MLVTGSFDPWSQTCAGTSWCLSWYSAREIICVSPKKIHLLVITLEKLRDINFETIGQSKARKIRTPPEPLIHGANQKDCGSRGHEKTFNKEQSLCLCSSLFRKWTLKSLLLHEGNKVFGTNTRYKDWPPGPSTFISSSESRLGGLGLHRSWQNWSKAWRWRSLPWNDQI